MYCAVMFLPGRIFRASLLVTRLPSDKGVGAQVFMCHHVSCVGIQIQVRHKHKHKMNIDVLPTNQP